LSISISICIGNGISICIGICMCIGTAVSALVVVLVSVLVQAHTRWYNVFVSAVRAKSGINPQLWFCTRYHPAINWNEL